MKKNFERLPGFSPVVTADLHLGHVEKRERAAARLEILRPAMQFRLGWTVFQGIEFIEPAKGRFEIGALGIRADEFLHDLVRFGIAVAGDACFRGPIGGGEKQAFRKMLWMRLAVLILRMHTEDFVE